MTEKARFLTTVDRDKLREVIEDHLQKRGGTSNRSSSDTQDREEWEAPEVYAAFTPAGGIPALVFEDGPGIRDTPGRARCDVYRVLNADEDSPDSPVMDPVAHLDRLVYNLSTDVIPGSTWIIALRDKFGVWFAVPTSNGGAVCEGCGFLADVPLTTCFRIRMRGGRGRCNCIPSEGELSGSISVYFSRVSGWMTTGMENTCCGCSGAVFSIDPAPALTAGMLLQNVHISCLPPTGTLGHTGTGTGNDGKLTPVTLRQVCCGRNPVTGMPYVAFVGWGPDSCNGGQVACDNVYYMTAECVRCPTVICTCCCLLPSPPAWILYGGSIFTTQLFKDNRLNGSWVLTYVPDSPLGHCTWRGRCAPTNTTSTLWSDGTTFWLNHGGALYKIDASAWACASLNTLNWVSGGGPSPPTTITLEPLFPYTAPGSGSGSKPNPLTCSPPDRLVVEIVSPGCPLFTFTVTVVRNVGANTWTWTNPSPSGDYIGTVQLACVYGAGSGWILTAGGTCAGHVGPWGLVTSGPPAISVFDPFFLQWTGQSITGPNNAPSCCNTGSGTIVTVSM